MKYTPKELPPEGINNTDQSRASFLIRAFSILVGILAVLYLLSATIPPVLTFLTPLAIEEKFGNSLFKGKFEFLVTPLDQKTQTLWDKLHSTLPKRLRDKGVYYFSSDEENAFALPGGRVFLTKDFIKNSESDNEKLFVMAHELGHHYYRHPLTSFYGGVLNAGLGALVMGGDDFANLMLSATGMSFSRDQEREADMYALDLVQKVSGNAKGAFDFFKRMHKKHGALESLSGLGGIFSTHPISKDRVEYLEAECRLKFGSESCF